MLRASTTSQAHIPVRAQSPVVQQELAGAEHLPKVRITIGEVRVSTTPVLLQTLLGSCVTVCLQDHVKSVAGMNHILLPHGSTQGLAARFGIHAMELLINDLMRIGADRRRLVAKAFGGSNVLSCLTAPTVGDLNAQFVREFLQAEGIPMVAERFGGTSAMHVSFRTDTGAVGVRRLKQSVPNALLAQESQYLRTDQRKLVADNSPVLF